VEIGQCPSFTSQQLAHSRQASHLVWVYIASVVAAALLLMGGVVGGALWHEKDVTLRVAIAKHEERWVLVLVSLLGGALFEGSFPALGPSSPSP
jgi:hypothetical protein